MEHFISLTQALAWPLTVIIIALLFRVELKGIFARMSNVKYKDFEANFLEREIREFTHKVEKSLPQAEVKNPLDSINQKTAVFSRDALVGAWTSLGVTVKEMSKRHGVEVGPNTSATDAMRQLYKQGGISDDMFDFYNAARYLHSHILYTPNLKVDPEETMGLVQTIKIIDKVFQEGMEKKDSDTQQAPPVGH